MRHSDLIIIPLFYNIEKKTADYGKVMTYLMVRATFDPDLRKTLAENREIELMKGKIIINDKYGTLLQEFRDIEIQAHGSLPSKNEPGLDFACSFQDGVVRFNLYTYKLGIYVEHQDNSNAFKQAFEMGNTLSIEFVPDAIMFTDGTILK